MEIKYPVPHPKDNITPVCPISGKVCGSMHCEHSGCVMQEKYGDKASVERVAKMR